MSDEIDVSSLVEQQKTEIEQWRTRYNKLRSEHRIVVRRLAAYEASPPIFPQAMIEQVKKIRSLGVAPGDIAELYEIDEDRVERIMNNTEAPLIVRTRR